MPFSKEQIHKCVRIAKDIRKEFANVRAGGNEGVFSVYFLIGELSESVVGIPEIQEACQLTRECLDAIIQSEEAMDPETFHLLYSFINWAEMSIVSIDQEKAISAFLPAVPSETLPSDESAILQNINQTNGTKLLEKLSQFLQEEIESKSSDIDWEKRVNEIQEAVILSDTHPVTKTKKPQLPSQDNTATANDSPDTEKQDPTTTRKIDLTSGRNWDKLPFKKSDEDKVMAFDIDESLEIYESFYAESKGHIQELTLVFDQLVEDPDNREIMTSAYRALRTTRRVANFLDLHPIKTITQEMEKTMQLLSENKLQLDASLLRLLIKCKNPLEELLEQIGETIKSKELPSETIAVHRLAKMLKKEYVNKVPEDEKTEESEDTSKQKKSKKKASVKFFN